MSALDDYVPELLAWTGLGALIGATGYAIWRGVVALIHWLG